MSVDTRETRQDENLEERHVKAESLVRPYSYKRPEETGAGTKGLVKLARGEIIRGLVQIVKQKGGENNLHYHTNVETFWWVIRGKVRFYGPGDVVIGEFGANEGIVTPRYSRYWFENSGSEDLELLQIAASDSKNHLNGRTNVKPFPTELKITVLEEEKAAAGEAS